MAFLSQGIQVFSFSSNLRQSEGTASMVIGTSYITCAAGADLATMTVSYWVAPTNSTVLRPIRTVASTIITIKGTFPATAQGTTVCSIVGRFYRSIAGVTNVNVPTGNAPVVDITDFQSTARQKLIGLPDEGRFEFAMNYSGTVLAAQTELFQAKSTNIRPFGVMWSDYTQSATSWPSYCYFTGIISNIEPVGSVDEPIKANVSIEITGPVIYVEGYSC